MSAAVSKTLSDGSGARHGRPLKRSAPTPTDWMQLWNAVAYETVVQHDILAIRRKERRRLVKELDRAENGKEALIRTVTELDANGQEIEGKRKKREGSWKTSRDPPKLSQGKQHQRSAA